MWFLPFQSHASKNHVQSSCRRPLPKLLLQSRIFLGKTENGALGQLGTSFFEIMIFCGGIPFTSVASHGFAIKCCLDKGYESWIQNIHRQATSFKRITSPGQQSKLARLVCLHQGQLSIQEVSSCQTPSRALAWQELQTSSWWGQNQMPHAFFFAVIHVFIHSFLPSFLPSFVRSFVRSFVPSFLRSFIHSSIHFIIFSLHTI